MSGCRAAGTSPRGPGQGDGRLGYLCSALIFGCWHPPAASVHPWLPAGGASDVRWARSPQEPAPDYRPERGLQAGVMRGCTSRASQLAAAGPAIRLFSPSGQEGRDPPTSWARGGGQKEEEERGRGQKG